MACSSDLCWLRDECQRFTAFTLRTTSYISAHKMCVSSEHVLSRIAQSTKLSPLVLVGIVMLQVCFSALICIHLKRSRIHTGMRSADAGV